MERNLTDVLKEYAKNYPNDMDLGKMIRNVGNEHKYSDIIHLSYIYPNDMDLGKKIRKIVIQYND